MHDDSKETKGHKTKQMLLPKEESRNKIANKNVVINQKLARKTTFQKMVISQNSLEQDSSST